MYQALIALHSYTRWLVVLSLLYAVYRAYRGFTRKKAFTATDNAVRHWTATLAHIQLVIGITLYTKSPVVRYFWKNSGAAAPNFEITFYALVHFLLMLAAIVILTVGSALAKRKLSDKEKFSTMLLWYAVALLVIVIAIPWPFSPLSHRPYLR